jgi:hypothetical protein
MSRWLPPAGGGYSGRSAKSGRFVKQSTVKKNPKTTVKDSSSKSGRSATTGRLVRVIPKGKGSAGVSRAK